MALMMEKKGATQVHNMMAATRARLSDLEDRFESAFLAKSLKNDRFLRLTVVTRRLGLRVTR
jgi:hypothetical protein